jgi:hypothetical protein
MTSLLTEKEENEIAFEDFPFCSQSIAIIAQIIREEKKIYPS